MEKLAATCATAVESRVQIDGRIVTSRGPGTTIEFSITLVEQLYGKEKADEVSSILVYMFCLKQRILVYSLRFTCSPFEISWFVLTLARNILLLSLTKQSGYLKIRHRYVYVELPLHLLLYFNWSFISLKDSVFPFQILVPIAEDSEETEAIALADILRRAKANVVIAAIGNSLEVVGSCKVNLVADVLLDEVSEKSFDLIVLPVSSANSQNMTTYDKSQTTFWSYMLQ